VSPVTPPSDRRQQGRRAWLVSPHDGDLEHFWSDACKVLDSLRFPFTRTRMFPSGSFKSSTRQGADVIEAVVGRCFFKPLRGERAAKRQRHRQREGRFR
jgi:hypothetical protein